MIEAIRANAELVVRQMKEHAGEEFGYDLESVEWLAGYIERLRAAGSFDGEESRKKFTSVFGSYVGECLVRLYDGEWFNPPEGGWAVLIPGVGQAFPFAKTAKQIEDGPADSVAALIRAIPMVKQLETRRSAPGGSNVLHFRAVPETFLARGFRALTRRFGRLTRK